MLSYSRSTYLILERTSHMYAISQVSPIRNLNRLPIMLIILDAINKPLSDVENKKEGDKYLSFESLES